MRKNVLLYLGKFPGFGNDVDGGSILARQLIDSLKDKCNLDVVFIRKNEETYHDSVVRSIRYVTYLDAFNNKFVRRLENLETNRDALQNFLNYDRIVTAHVSKFFGMKVNETEFWRKTVLFPMFCTPSYQKAGEFVPEEYTNLERLVLLNVNKIITPSSVEKYDLVSTYGCVKEKIEFIPRGINPCFHFKSGGLSKDRIKIVYVASIKPQKNNLDALRLIKLLRQSSDRFELHLVCTLQNMDIYQKLLLYAQDNNISDSVYYHVGLSQTEVSNLLQEMDVNISVSNWETFGRGIYEGISSGLPTFVMNRLEEVKHFIGEVKGVKFVEDIQEMATGILEICMNEDKYLSCRESLYEVSQRVSYQTESQRLIQEILYE